MFFDGVFDNLEGMKYIPEGTTYRWLVVWGTNLLLPLVPLEWLMVSLAPMTSYV